MRCEKAQKLLALESGGDLAGGRRREVTAHVEECEACRSLANDLEASAAWMREALPPPISDAAYAQMRREVWRRIESGEKAPAAAGIGRFAWAAAGVFAAALAAILLAPRTPRESAVAASRPVTVASPAPPAAVPALSPVAEAPAAAASAPSAEPLRVAVARPRTSHRRRLPSPPAGDSPVEKIEFRTANPNVRIIWLVRKGEEKSSSNAAGRIEEVS